MEAILGLILIILFICLIIGLVNPSKILKWDKKPNRIKVFIYWFILCIVITAILPKESNETDKVINDILKNDSLDEINENPPLTEEEKKNQQKEKINREIESINDGVDFSIYRGTVESLQLELVMFGAWAITIQEGQDSEDEEIQKISKKLRSKVEKIQKKEFPILRKELAKVYKNKLWEFDIDVYSSGGSKVKYINLTGATFAANKNIKDMQLTISENLEMFRFNQARYRWYKGEDEYTYYTIYEGKDSDLVTFN
tara:strand:- start:113 stop:880 length:768 start_codon:yes stop_codon:yes gene_type:complete